MPDPGTVYRLGGENLIYVRTTDDEHYFVKARNGAVYHVKLRDFPREAELVIDMDGRKQAKDAQAALQIEQWNKNLAFSLLGKACAWLPRERAEQLRQEFRDYSLVEETDGRS